MWKRVMYNIQLQDGPGVPFDKVVHLGGVTSQGGGSEEQVSSSAEENLGGIVRDDKFRSSKKERIQCFSRADIQNV